MRKEYQTPEIEIIEFDAEVQMMLTLSNTPQENIDNDFNLDNSGWEVQNKFLDKTKQTGRIVEQILSVVLFTKINLEITNK